MTVDEFADALGSTNLEFIREGSYTNGNGQVGYWATYRDLEQYLWFSVSSTEIPLAPDEVAAAITSPQRWVARENPYPNKAGQLGFEVTVLSKGHAFMLGATPW